jgi:succinate-acetate transporter protein
MVSHNEVSPTDSIETPTTFAIGDPTALGLGALGLTTFVFSAVNTRWLGAGVASVVLSVALFYGGLAQFAAGMWAFRRGHALAATVFSSIGAFWFSYWGLHQFFSPSLVGPRGSAVNALGDALGVFYLSWAILTVIFVIAALRTTGVLVAVLAALAVTFACLAVSGFHPGDGWLKAGGWAGMVTAALAAYGVLAALVNETWKRPVLPVWRGF